MSDNIYVQLLKSAKRRIQSGETYICLAVKDESAAIWRCRESEAAMRIVHWINAHIVAPEGWKSNYGLAFGEYAGVKEWLELQPGVNPDDLTAENMREYRLRWLDYMIEQWEDVK